MTSEESSVVADVFEKATAHVTNMKGRDMEDVPCALVRAQTNPAPMAGKSVGYDMQVSSALTLPSG
jgi:hypothetical protein